MVTFNNTFQQRMFLFPTKCPVVSSENEWNPGSAATLFSPRSSKMEFTSIALLFARVPVPKLMCTHNIEKRLSQHQNICVLWKYVNHIYTMKCCINCVQGQSAMSFFLVKFQVISDSFIWQNCHNKCCWFVLEVMEAFLNKVDSEFIFGFGAGQELLNVNADSRCCTAPACFRLVIFFKECLWNALLSKMRCHSLYSWSIFSWIWTKLSGRFSQVLTFFGYPKDWIIAMSSRTVTFSVTVLVAGGLNWEGEVYMFTSDAINSLLSLHIANHPSGLNMDRARAANSYLPVASLRFISGRDLATIRRGERDRSSLSRIASLEIKVFPFFLSDFQVFSFTLLILDQMFTAFLLSLWWTNSLCFPWLIHLCCRYLWPHHRASQC